MQCNEGAKVIVVFCWGDLVINDLLFDYIEILSALSELESLATHNPSVLHQFSDYLNSCLHSDLEGCRQLAFNLILRHMTYSPGVLNLLLKEDMTGVYISQVENTWPIPGASKLYLKSILEALKYQVGSRTIETLVDRIPEFVALAQGNSKNVR